MWLLSRGREANGVAPSASPRRHQEKSSLDPDWRRVPATTTKNTHSADQTIGRTRNTSTISALCQYPCDFLYLKIQATCGQCFRRTYKKGQLFCWSFLVRVGRVELPSCPWQGHIIAAIRYPRTRRRVPELARALSPSERVQNRVPKDEILLTAPSINFSPNKGVPAPKARLTASPRFC
jgi:hypothetical protein